MHIVFGSSGITLLHSKDPKFSEDQIISLQDDLRMGPINLLENETELRQREEWFSPIVKDCLQGYINHAKAVMQDKLLIQNEITKVKEIYIWTGETLQETLGTARLIYELKDLDIKINLTDFSNIKIQAANGRTIEPKTMIVISPDQVKQVEETFYLISNQEKKSWIELWESMANHEKNLRVFGDNRQITEVEESYFDEAILKYCTNIFQKSAWVISGVLFEIDFAISDFYLNWRAKELVRRGELKAEGQLRDLRDYSLKLS